MREATKEERESIARYIDSISVEMIPITVLENIRAEISYTLKNAPYLYDNEHLEELDGMQDGLNEALEIIDKHDPSKAGKPTYYHDTEHDADIEWGEEMSPEEAGEILKGIGEGDI